jgi:hypothetical protein
MNVTGLARCKKQICCTGVLQGLEEAAVLGIMRLTLSNKMKWQEQDCNATVFVSFVYEKLKFMNINRGTMSTIEPIHLLADMVA